MRDSLGTGIFGNFTRGEARKYWALFNRLNLFTLDLEVNRFGENGPREWTTRKLGRTSKRRLSLREALAEEQALQSNTSLGPKLGGFS
jgi:hypothetical protein